MHPTRRRPATGTRPARFALFALLFLWAAAGGSSGRAPAALLDSGPLPVRDRFVLGLGFLAFEPGGARVEATGRWRLELVGAVANSWSQSDRLRVLLRSRGRRGEVTLDELRAIEPLRPGAGLFFVDGEVRSMSLTLRRGLGSGLEAWVSAPVVAISGGSTDGLVEGFHDLARIGQGARSGSVRDAYLVYYRAADGREVFRETGSGMRLGDVVVGVKRRLGSPGGRLRTAVEGAVKLPTGSEERLLGSGSVDAGARFLGEVLFRQARLRAGVGLVLLGEAATLGLAQQTVASGWLGGEVAVGGRASLVLQLSGSEGPFGASGIARLEDRVLLLDLGVKIAGGRRDVFFFAVSENLNRGNSSDLGLHAGLLRSF